MPIRVLTLLQHFVDTISDCVNDIANYILRVLNSLNSLVLSFLCYFQELDMFFSQSEHRIASLIQENNELKRKLVLSERNCVILKRDVMTLEVIYWQQQQIANKEQLEETDHG